MRKKILFRILAFGFIPFLIVVAEFYLQYRHAKKVNDRGLTVLTEPDEYLGYRLKRNSFSADGLAYINSDGIRGDSVHTAKSVGFPRILILGNSCAFGAGCRDTEIFSFQLEKMLRSNGYESATWPFYVPALQLGGKMKPEPKSISKMFQIFERSRLFWSLRSRIRGWSNSIFRSDSGRDTWNQAYLNNFERNMSEIKNWCDERKIKVFFCRLPFDIERHPEKYSDDAFKYSKNGYKNLYQEFDFIIKKIGKENVIDLPAAISGREGEMDVIYDYNHLGIEGHRLAADTIFEFLILKGITY
ncbi:MAG: hypothetical protein COS94_00690 [Candidatus Hydrogenedentes bacterium CG07_land_8_20_14_0_80_42_17]|nr:MAG: hypothetical protein COS94_00690 [Candidatus Hydrogenedentes bacterium CG07_land_8_20_14_0_80_42_17]